MSAQSGVAELLRRPYVGAAIMLAIGAVIPFVSGGWLTFFIKGYAFGLAAVGLNVLYYYTGLLSFGHALFYSVGAYTLAILTVKAGWGLGPAVAAALVVTLLVALGVGYVSLRHTRIYFALLTLAFGQLFYVVIVKYHEITGGTDGLQGIPKPEFLIDDRVYYFFAMGVTAVVLALTWYLLNTPLGMSFQAVRDNAERASLLGINVRLVRLVSFTVSALLASIGGILLALYDAQVAPEIAYWTESANLVFAVLLGGASWFLGPLVGGIILTLLSAYLTLKITYWLFVLGVILILLTLFLPDGLATLLKPLARERR